MTKTQATRFRRAFRRWALLFGETNSTIGDALDAYVDLRGDRGEGGGAKVVANAMMTNRKLTHRTARRCVVALFLAPSRERDAEHEYAALDDLASVLVNSGALPVVRALDIPAFIPLNSVDTLARRLAYAPLRGSGIGAKTRKPLYDALRKSLRQHAASMGRAWGDATVKHPMVKSEKAGHLVEILLEDAFQDSYLYPSTGPGWGREFDLLSRERPELNTLQLEVDAAL